MLMGDEYGHTRYGNNNSYGHDTAINHFQWGLVSYFSFGFFLSFNIDEWLWNNLLAWQLESRKNNHFRFFKEVINYRKTHCVFGRDTFLEKVISLLSLVSYI